MCGSYLDGYNKRGLLRALFNYLFNLFHYLIKEQLKKTMTCIFQFYFHCHILHDNCPRFQ